MERFRKTRKSLALAVSQPGNKTQSIYIQLYSPNIMVAHK